MSVDYATSETDGNDADSGNNGTTENGSGTAGEASFGGGAGGCSLIINSR